MTTEDYATSQKLAMYLEAGWSDFLFAPSSDAPASNEEVTPSPLCEFVKPTFFQEVANLAKSWANAISLKVARVCDVGGGTGRTIFELEHQFSSLNQLILVEPSPTFCKWAEMLLMSERSLPNLPQVNSATGPKMVSPHRKPPSIPMAADRLSIRNRHLEECGDLTDVDLVTCLNVVDRHEQPQEMVFQIKKMMRPGGLLVLSSPFDFHAASTPDEGNWIEDLDALFDNSWDTVGESELVYEFRPFNRKWTSYRSQVVGKRWPST